MHHVIHADGRAGAVLTVKKILAGRGAVDYYLNQTRRGLGDYYLPEGAGGGDGAAGLSAPGSSWWGSGAEVLALSGGVGRAEFEPLYAKAAHPDGGHLGRRFRLPEEAAAAKAEALHAASEITDPYERWMAKHEVRRRAPHASVAAWDCTFSPPKSVSLLWAAGDAHLQQQVWAAHLAAVDAGLGYLQEHAGYVRAGRNGVRVLDTTGLVVARMNEWTSRDGDMHLHTHCLILNRAQTAEDGKWRALDGRALLSARTGAGALYNRTLEAELTRRLGVAWRDRPDGLRELAGVDDELIEAFSSRRRAITAAVEQLAAAYREKYGVEAPTAVRSAMGQTAWANTRRRKQDLAPAEALAAWEATARAHGRQLARLPAQVLARHSAPADSADWEAVMGRLLARLAASTRATFTRHDLLRAALDVLPLGGLSRGELQTRAELLVDWAVTRPELVGVTAPDVLDTPAERRRRDGTSVYTQPARQRWALAATLDQEAWLLEVAVEPAGRTLEHDVLEAAVAEHALGRDQAEAVRELLGSERRVGLLVGPAGAGKTRTLRAVAAAWQHTGGHVLGLTVSQAAAQVLSAEAQVRAKNTAKWLHETRRGRWRLPDGSLVLIDEASMVTTADLVELVEQARRAGGKVLLVGDPAQLSAIGTGGAFGLLADRHSAAQLREVRRFIDDWEADASLALRRRDPTALPEYAMRGRIHAGTTDQIETGLFEAWRADACTRYDTGRASALMIVATNEQAAVLSERARHALIQTGAVTDGPTVQLRDNVASVGDHIVTRRNDRRLRTSTRGWVVNGDVWTVIHTYPDGAADVRRNSDGSTLTLPADYLAEHTHLAYATTAHRAQGMTVDVCHAAVTAETSHEQLYVAATRGRNANHLWVIVDSDRDTVRDYEDLPDPEQILARILARTDPDRLSAHQVLEDSLRETTSLARLGEVFEDAARAATAHWLATTLTAHGLHQALDNPEWPALLARAREAALAGHDLPALLDEAINMRPIDDARSAAAVLHWRFDSLGATPAPRARGLLASLPPTDGPDIDIAHQAGELIRQRWHDLRATLAITNRPLPWAPDLGPRPADPADKSAWLSAATAVTAYRERYEIPDHTPMLGVRPAPSRPDAQAAWDHACLHADRYLVRRLRDLDDQALADLDARQQAILENAPYFDPAELERARQRLDNTRAAGHPRRRPDSPEQLLVQRLERTAAAHRDWRRAATDALDIRRQIALEHQRRQRAHSIRPPALRLTR
jgi:conjugative relaxase-like TrwC/TraI family protein